MVGIDINNIIKDKLKSIIEHRELNENGCKNLNIEKIIISIFLYGKALGLNYKCEANNFIPNLDEFFPLNLFELRKKILIYNIKLLKKINAIPLNYDENELYKKQISGEICIPQYNYFDGVSSQLPIYNIANLITNYISFYHETVISSNYLLLPSNTKKEVKSSWVNDIIIESFTTKELHDYLYDIFNKCIDEYLILIEKNFPTLKENLKYYNLFKSGVKIKMYLYKENNTSLWNYTVRLWYCYSESKGKEIEIVICDEEDVPNEINERWISREDGGTDIYFFNSFNSNKNNEYLVLSNIIYKLIKSDFENLLSDDENNLSFNV